MSNTLVTLTQDYLHFTVCFYQSAQISPTYFKNHQKYQNKLSLVWYGMVYLFHAWVVLATQSGIRTPLVTSVRPLIYLT